MSESKVVQVIGENTFAWDEAAPLVFSMIGQDKGVTYTDAFDLSDLNCFTHELLLGIKDIVLNRSMKVKRSSLVGEFAKVKRLLKAIEKAQSSLDESQHLMTGSIGKIDQAFMLALRERLAADLNWIGRHCLQSLRCWFNQFGNVAVFQGLARADFPIKSKENVEDRLRQNIIKQALSRSVQVAVMIEVDRLMTAGEIPSPVWVMWNLVNCTYLRPESMRTLRCQDLQAPEKAGESYTLWVHPAKRPKGGTQKPNPYELPAELGQILQTHILWVIEELGHSFGLHPGLDEASAEKIKRELAMFPRYSGAPSDDEISNLGVVKTSGNWERMYLTPIQTAVDAGCSKVNFTVMRHTIGTQLAASGVAPAIIQAVLRHAKDTTCKLYVDLAAREMRKVLNEGLKELETLFPAYGAFTDSAEMRGIKQTAPQKVIRLGAVGGFAGGDEESGQCGGKAACQYAPLSCYGCNLWIANIDADHQIPLEYVRNRIRQSKELGHIAKLEVERDTLLEKLIQLRIAQIEQYKARDEPTHKPECSPDLARSRP